MSLEQVSIPDILNNLRHDIVLRALQSVAVNHYSVTKESKISTGGAYTDHLARDRHVQYQKQPAKHIKQLQAAGIYTSNVCCSLSFASLLGVVASRAVIQKHVLSCAGRVKSDASAQCELNAECRHSCTSCPSLHTKGGLRRLHRSMQV